MLPITQADMQRLPAGSRCETRVQLQPNVGGQPPKTTLLLIQDGRQAIGRFARLQAPAPYQSVAESSSILIRTDRGRDNGLLRFVLAGSLPADVDPTAYETYRVTLDLSSRNCDSSDATAASRCYSGFLAVMYRLRAAAAPDRSISVPAVAVIAEEHCANDDYRYAGLFSFPGLFERLSAWIIGPH